METQFDRPNAESYFFKFVEQEFFKIGSEVRRMLVNKEKAALHVKTLGYRVPKRFCVLSDVSELTNEHIGASAVLKYGKGWSSEGVMLLDLVGDNSYFDSMSLTSLTIPDIIQKQRKIQSRFNHADAFWIIEEFLKSIYPLGRIPFDYKFYTFYGEVAAIIQIDRNTTPPKTAIFDGDFIPLRTGCDYIHSSAELQPGIPLIPLHAIEMLRMAAILSRSTSSPFSSIDLYDTPDGPVFGEFTFSPGAIQKRLFKFSQRMINHFDQCFLQAQNNLCDGTQSYKFANSANYENDEYIDLNTFQILTAFTYNNGSRGALRLAEHFHNKEIHETDADKIESFRFLKKSWHAVRDLVKYQPDKYAYKVSNSVNS